MHQSNLSKNATEFNNKSKPISTTIEGKSKDKKRDTYEIAYDLYEGRELILNVFNYGIFSIKETQGKGLKMLTPKQMLQTLKVALAQVKHKSEYYIYEF